MNEFLDYMNQILLDVQNGFLDDANGFRTGAQLIAGLGATISAAFAFYKMSMGEANEWKPFAVKLLAVYLGIIFYGPFIQILNTPLNIISESAKSVAKLNDDNTKNFFDDFHNEKKEKISNETLDAEIQEKMERFNDQHPEISENVFGTGLSLLTGGASVIDGFINSAAKSIRAYMIEAFYEIMKFLGMCAIIILSLVRTFFLIVLQVFGLFAIAFSIFPILGNSFSQWLQKYINVYLWLPISYILQGIINALFSSIDLNTAISPGAIIADGANYSSGMMGNSAVAVIGLCSVVGFSTVPTMSSWLVSAATNGLSSKIKGKTMEGAKGGMKGVASKGASIATGGKSAIAEKALGAVTK